MRAQYFTAVSSQRALRHVGISEADYAMQFIWLNQTLLIRTHRTHPRRNHKNQTSNCSNYISRREEVKNAEFCLAGDATKCAHQMLAKRNVITKMSPDVHKNTLKV